MPLVTGVFGSMIFCQYSLLTLFSCPLYSRETLFTLLLFLVGAFAFQGFFDVGVNKWYENHNKGKLWKDVKGKFLEGGDDDEDDE